MEKTEAAVNTAKFYWSILGMFILIAAVMYFWPSIFPLKLWDLFFFKFSLEAFSSLPWTLLLLGPGLTLLGRLLTKNSRQESYSIRADFKKNLWTSIKAGIFEEVYFRWLIFFYLIAAFTLDNWLLGWLTGIGWINSIITLPWFAWVLAILGINALGLIALAIFNDKSTRGCTLNTIALAVLVFVGILDFTIILIFTKFWYTKVALPVVNWLTLGKLSSQLFDYSWMFGAALITANGRFQSGHAYQGCIGWLNSWVIGMLMFVFAFNFGILFAMLVHAIYDILIDVIVFSDAVLDNGR